MVDFKPQSNVTHLLVDNNDWNRVLAQAFEKEWDYLIRINGSYYEAIKGKTNTDAGTIAFGGSENAGSVSGASFDAVLTGCLAAIGNYGKIHLNGGIFPTAGINISNSATVTDSDRQWIELEGEGFGNTIIRGTTTATGASSSDGAFTEKAWIMVDSFNTSGIRVYIHDLQVDGQNTVNPNVVEGICVRYGRNAVIERCWIQNVSKYGINMVGPNVSYRECYLRNNIIYNVNDLDLAPSAPYEDNCAAIKSTFADLYIKDNVIGWVGYNNTTFTATSNGAANGTTIINTAHTQADDFWNTRWITMETGTCAGEVGKVINFDAATDTITVAGFTAQIDAGDTYKFDAVGYGIAMEDSDIADGNIIWVARAGIFTLQDSTDHVIINNYVDFTYAAAIYLFHADRATCQNNTIRACYNEGIHVEDGTENSVQNNHFILRDAAPANRSLGFIVEGGLSDYNSVFSNDCLTGGTVATPLIVLVGRHSVQKNNMGFWIGGSGTPFNNTNHDIIQAGDSGTPAASTDYTVRQGDIIISSTNSGNSDCAILVKAPNGASMKLVAGTLDFLYVPVNYIINWGAYTGAAPTVVASWCY